MTLIEPASSRLAKGVGYAWWMDALKRHRLWLALAAWPLWTFGTIPFFAGLPHRDGGPAIIWEAGIAFVTVVLGLEGLRALRGREPR